MEYFCKIGNLIAPCPKCGGAVRFGDVHDWPPDLGGNYLHDLASCKTCGKEWTSDEAPKEFFTADGEYWLTENIEEILAKEGKS